MSTQETQVAIVGAGPTGLALACELRLAGIDCVVLERRAEEPNLTRAFAVHARTLELLDGRGLAGQVLDRGVRVPSVQPAPGVNLDLRIVRSPSTSFLSSRRAVPRRCWNSGRSPPARRFAGVHG